MTHDSDDDTDDPRCPVCRERSMSDNLQSQGLILTGMKALYDGDEQAIRSVYDALTQYDGHTAIGLAAGILHDFCMVTGLTAEKWITHYRKALNEAQAEAS